MRKKNLPAEQPVVAREILEQAKLSAGGDTLRRPAAKCSVCASEVVAPTSNEQLCWVCRRLKISAWRDSDVQINAQE